MKVIISVLNNEAYPIMAENEETMEKFIDEKAAREWCDVSILGKASENHIIDLETGEMENY